MKFEISRASSGWGDKTPPCKGAAKKGENYEIEVSSLEELIAIIAEVKTDLIVSRDSILIYDDRVE